jgi:hypothetical protein
VTDPRPVGEMVDALGIRAKIRPDDLICGAIVVIAVMEPDGILSLRCCASGGLNWLEKRGMLETALDLERRPGM